LWAKELKKIYFFGFLALGMCAFGCAFLPILTRQEGRRKKGEGRREKGIKEDVWIPAYFMQGLARINADYTDLLPRKGTKRTKK